MSSKLDLQSAYRRWFGVMQSGMRPDEAVQQAIGGQFEPFGLIQVQMLRHFGLRDTGFLVDIGCGSGRTAIPLSRGHAGPYLGTDLVEELVAHARASCARPDWRFEVVDGLTVPAPDGVADMVCMFSVLTHLLHEQSYLYLEEARRVLKPGGRVLFSFLEFARPFHWDVFAATVEDARASDRHPLNVFVDRCAIHAWASHLGLEVEVIRDGDDAFVPLAEPVTLDDGRVMSGFGNLGQSICVLRKPG